MALITPTRKPGGKKMKAYKATRAGCVVEIADGSVIYEPIEGISAREIAAAMNELKAEGVPEEWDWKKVERRLYEKGVIAELRA
jgi:hypothetical protein